MEDLKNKINEKLNKIKEMITKGERGNKIEQERKELDKLLKEYLKEI